MPENSAARKLIFSPYKKVQLAKEKASFSCLLWLISFLSQQIQGDATTRHAPWDYYDMRRIGTESG
jgi:hypothetical protein